MIGWRSLGRGATAWRPWADGRCRVGLLARHVDAVSANGRDAVAPLPMPLSVSPCPRVPSLRLRRRAQISKSVPDSESASCATVKPVSDLSKRFETSRQSAAT